MIGRSILGKTSVPILKKIMDVSCLRQKVIARNIANATTPGYREKRVLFETKLRNALSSGQIRGISTDTGHLAIGGNKIDSCLLYTSPSPRDRTRSRMPSSA